MSVVLGIDTAGPVVGAAVVGPGLMRMWSERVARGADSALIPAVADLIGDLTCLDRVAVSVGPGAFTGLRVGVATALGIAVARQCRVVCVSSLEARAFQAEHDRILSLLDARKSRVYAQLFDGSGEHLSALSEPVDAPLNKVLPSGPFLATGEGALLDVERIESAGGVVDMEADRSPAVAVAQLGQIRAQSAIEPHQVALTYLRDADAKKPRSISK